VEDIVKGFKHWNDFDTGIRSSFFHDCHRNDKYLKIENLNGFLLGNPNSSGTKGKGQAGSSPTIQAIHYAIVCSFNLPKKIDRPLDHSLFSGRSDLVTLGGVTVGPFY